MVPKAPPTFSRGAFGEPMASSPLWLAHSGLPEWLGDKVNRSAWLVFKTVVEIDCAQNARPSTVEVMFMPPRAVIKGRLDVCEASEAELDVAGLVERSLAGVEVIDVAG